MRVWGLGLRVQGLGFGVWGLGLGLMGFRVWGLGGLLFRGVRLSGFRVQWSRFHVPRFRG